MTPVNRFYLGKELIPICLNELESKISRSCQGLWKCGHHSRMLAVQLNRAEEAQEKALRSLFSSGSSVALRPPQTCPSTSGHTIEFQAKLTHVVKQLRIHCLSYKTCCQL